MAKQKDSAAVQEAEAALETARVELADTRSRLALEETMTDRLVQEWVESEGKARQAIEAKQLANQLARLNLAALTTKLEGNVKDKEQALKEAQREVQIGVCLERLGECASAADRIRTATREILEAHCEYQDRKIAYEGARNALRRVCPGGDLAILKGTEEGPLISQGPKLAQVLRQPLQVWDRSAKTLAALESSGALSSDIAAVEAWQRRLWAKMGIGPRPASFENTRVWRAGTKW